MAQIKIDGIIYGSSNAKINNEIYGTNNTADIIYNDITVADDGFSWTSIDSTWGSQTITYVAIR